MATTLQSTAPMRRTGIWAGRRRTAVNVIAEVQTGAGQQQQRQPARAAGSAADSRRSGALPEVMARPSTCLSALGGFVLIASNIPITDLDAVVQSAGDQASQQQPVDQASLQQLLANGGAAQAASMDAAAQVHDPGVVPLISNPLLQLDESIHHYVATHTTEAFRLMADVVISDAFITAGVLGWLACTAACLAKAPSKSAGALGAAWAFYFATCGAVGHGDPLLVDTLKHLFARARPSTLHHTFSFPSGHTSAAVFLVGSLLTVLVPLTLHLLRDTEASSSSSSSLEPNPDGQASSDSTVSSVSTLQLADATALMVWAAAWLTTASGRILSESHWLSDTMAGGLLAIASVSGLACCSKLLVPYIGSSSSSEKERAA